MKLTKKLVALLATVVASMFGSATMADSYWDTIEFEGEATGYLDCLGENVAVHNWTTILYREFDSPSGNSHYIERWTWDGVWTGEDTGRVWHAEGRSPGSFQVMKGEVGQWTTREKAIPIEGDGPRLMFINRYKYAVDANGNLRVFYESLDVNDNLRCLGPNH